MAHQALYSNRITEGKVERRNLGCPGCQAMQAIGVLVIYFHSRTAKVLTRSKTFQPICLGLMEVQRHYRFNSNQGDCNDFAGTAKCARSSVAMKMASNNTVCQNPMCGVYSSSVKTRRSSSTGTQKPSRETSFSFLELVTERKSFLSMHSINHISPTNSTSTSMLHAFTN